MHGWDHAHVRSGEDSQRDVDHLQVLGTGRGRDLAGTRPVAYETMSYFTQLQLLLSSDLPDVVNDGVLEPGDPEVETLGVHGILDATEAGEDNGTMTSIH